MKIQHFAIIFVIIVLPISFLLNSYIQSHIDIVSTKTSYDSKISDSMHDAIEAFELNTLQNSNTQKNKSRDVQAAISTFYNSLGTNLSYTGQGEKQLQTYTPAILFTLYDGYYVYSKYKDTQTYKLEYQLNPYSYYSCRYVKDDNYDFTVNYTLDNYITIIGKVNGEVVNKSGYFIDITKLDDTTKTKIDRGETVNSLKWDGAEIKREVLDEYLISINSDNEIVENKYYYTIYNGEKVYKDIDNRYFKYNNYKKIYITDNNIINELNSLTLQSRSALEYYITGYNFTKWVLENLSTITPSNSIDAKTGKAIEFGLHDNIKSEYIFKLDSVKNDPEKKDSIFFMHKQSVIRNKIENHLEYVIANYNDSTPLTYAFALPNIKETDWEKIINNVTMLTFVQGIKIKGTYYNNYCVMQSDSNKEIVTPKNIRICTNDGVYHKLGCKTMIDKSVKDANFLTMPVLERNTKREEIVLSKDNKIYYYKYRLDKDTAYTNCYDCIVNITNDYNVQDIIKGDIKDENGTTIYTKTNLEKIRSLYFTILAREKYEMRKAPRRIEEDTINVKVGDTVNYSPSGTYEWNKEYATSDSTGTTTLSSASGESFNITTWKVLSVDKSTGKIEMVPASPTTGTVRLQGAQGYNNAVYLLNNACSSLYGNASKGITARSITEEDFAEIGGTTWTNYRAAYKGTVKYGSQYTSAYTTNRYYPTIYAQEKNSVINGTKSTTGYSQSEQTSLIERADSSATNGRLQASTSIQPYQTYYNTKNYTTTANLLGGYGAILLPNGSSTQYWVASRCVNLDSSACYFNVRRVVSGCLNAYDMLNSRSGTGGSARSLFPVVSLSSELLETTATDGTYNVK